MPAFSEVLIAVMHLTNRFIPLALASVAPIVVDILTFLAVMALTDRAGIAVS